MPIRKQLFLSAEFKGRNAGFDVSQTKIQHKSRVCYGCWDILPWRTIPYVSHKKIGDKEKPAIHVEDFMLNLTHKLLIYKQVSNVVYLMDFYLFMFEVIVISDYMLVVN